MLAIAAVCAFPATLGSQGNGDAVHGLYRPSLEGDLAISEQLAQTAWQFQ
jgi:hypothetical protein